MNEIYKKLTTIKSNKLKFKKVFKKIIFSFSKVNFSLLEKKILLKSRFFFTFIYMNVQKFRHMFLMTIFRKAKAKSKVAWNSGLAQKKYIE